MTGTERIRELNDRFRRTGEGGMVVITPGVLALNASRDELLASVASFETFEEGNDPYGEHDFGAFDFRAERLFWKIDYYDPTLIEGAVDPADAVHTVRVLTIMLADEY